MVTIDPNFVLINTKPLIIILCLEIIHTKPLPINQYWEIQIQHQLILILCQTILIHPVLNNSSKIPVNSILKQINPSLVTIDPKFVWLIINAVLKNPNPTSIHTCLSTNKLLKHVSNLLHFSNSYFQSISNQFLWMSFIFNPVCKSINPIPNCFNLVLIHLISFGLGIICTESITGAEL